MSDSRRRAVDESGSVALEAALVVPALVGLVLGAAAALVPVVDGLVLDEAARTAARAGALGGDAAARSAVDAVAPGAAVVIARRDGLVVVEVRRSREVLGVEVETTGRGVVPVEPGLVGG